MPEPQESPKINQEQEAILSRCLYLKAFIEQPPLSFQQWFEGIKPVGRPLEDEVTAILGNNWGLNTVAPIAITTFTQDIFKKDQPTDELFNLVYALFLIGYEVGDKRDAFKFITPVVLTIRDSGMLRAPVPENEARSYASRLINTVQGVMEAGVFVKFMREKQESQLPTTPSSGASAIPKPFRDFIATLDLDLDKKE